jgi:hypothetical protein
MKTSESRDRRKVLRWSGPPSGWLETVVYLMLGSVALAAAWQCQLALIDFASGAAAVGERLMEPRTGLVEQAPMPPPAAGRAAWAAVDSSTNLPAEALGDRTSVTRSAI